MSDEQSKPNYLPYAVIAVLAFMLLRDNGKQSDNAKSMKSVVGSTLPTIRTAYRDAFLTAAAKIEAKEITNKEQWTAYIAQTAGVKQREALDAVYKAIDDAKVPASFAGVEAEVARLNREIGGAW